MRRDLHSLLARFVLVESAEAADSIRAAIAGDLGGNHLCHFLYSLVNGETSGSVTLASAAFRSGG